MTTPNDPVRDFMRRSLFNLRYVELSDDAEGQEQLLQGKDPELRNAVKRERMNTRGFHRGLPTFEFTALVNTFMMCMVHPWEKHYEKDFADVTLEGAQTRWGLPIITFRKNNQSVSPETITKVVSLFRNALAHGNIRVLPSSRDIWNVTIWNIPYHRRGTPVPPESEWTYATMTASTMREFLFAFVRMTEDVIHEVQKEEAQPDTVAEAG